MSDVKQMEARRVVHAPAARVFAVLADPRRHPTIDGSGMLQGTSSDSINAAGQEFAMRMHHDDLGDYQTVNTVTAFEPDVVVGWAPRLDTGFECELVGKLADIRTGGHTYTYRLRDADGGTEVTETYDWSGVTDPRFEAFCPFVTREQLAGTLEKLARAVEAGPGGEPEAITALERAYEKVAGYVAGVDPDRLSAATPCTGWDVRALLNHLLAAAREFTLVNLGQSAGPNALDLLSGTHDFVKGDPAGVLAAAAKENVDSWRRPGALDGERTYSFGTFPAFTALMINLDEVVVHAWDLAKATGQDPGIDPAVAESLYSFYRASPLDDARAAGFFAPEVPVPDTAPAAERLLGLLGRQP